MSDKPVIEWTQLPTTGIDGQLRYRSAYFHEQAMGNYWYLELEERESNTAIRLGLKDFELSDMKYSVRFSLIMKKGDQVISTLSKTSVFSNCKLTSEFYILPMSLDFINDGIQICLAFHEQRYVSIPVVEVESPRESSRVETSIDMRDYGQSYVPFPLVDIESPRVETSGDMKEYLLFLRNGDLHDMVIKVDNEEIKCHRCILSWRSPYLRAMISSVGDYEKKVIEVADFRHEIIKHMIDFLYTSECPKLSVEFGICLLKAAEKYQIPELRDACEKNLISDINAEKAIDVLLYADIYSAAEIKKIAMDYVCRNFTDFQDEKQYEPLMTRPDLFRELMLAKAKNG